MAAGRCSECGCTEKAALRRRWRLGLGIKVIGFTARTCTPKCGLAWTKRLWRAKYDAAYWRRIQARRRWRASSGAATRQERSP